jgi:hypothetical protein
MRIKQQLTRRKKLRGGLNPSNDGVVGPILNINDVSAQGPAKPPAAPIINDADDVAQAAAKQPDVAQEANPPPEAIPTSDSAQAAAIQTSDAPIYLKVKNAKNVPVITPGYLFATLNDISLDSKNLDTRLIPLGKLEKENSSEGSLPHFFYMFNVTPPSNESEFESTTSSGTTERIPFPAVLLIRCVMGEDKYLKIKAVYVVAGDTYADKYFRNTNTIEAKVNNLVKLEPKEEYQKRTTQNANDAPIIGKKTDLVLITSTWDSNLSPVDPLIEFINNELRTSDGSKSNYALHRFNIQTNERVIWNAARGIWMSATAPSGPPTVSAGTKVTVGGVKTGLVTALKDLIFSGGKRTKRIKMKMKYSTKKSKRKAKANATKHNRFKGFKYMTPKRK